jgi:apolipoprotein N-acyltransferase
VATGLGFAPIGLWPATLLGVAALTVSVKASRSGWAALAAGAAFGLGLTSTTLTWMAMITVGAAAGLIAVVSGWYVLLGLLLRLASKSPLWPVLSAGAWVSAEYAASTFPFGGFGWLRLGYAMLDSPLAGILPVLGVGGLSFATALTANLAVFLVRHRSLRPVAGGAVLGISALVLTSMAGATIELPQSSSVELGWVQGGAPGGGVFGLGAPGSTTRRHAAETTVLAEKILDGKLQQPDVVVWPENSTDTDPRTDEDTRRLVTSSSQAVRAPLLVGEILAGPGTDQRQTASQFWTSDGALDPTYVKRSIVPFGEWIPYRSLLLPLIPELRYVGFQTVAGQRPGVLALPIRARSTVGLGIMICFDVAFDQVAYDLPTNGAQVIVVQSSNAMYQGSPQVPQQFAITRARAAELRREIVVATTSGISGVIDSRGNPMTTASTGPASGVASIPVRDGITPAVVLALPLQQAIGLITVAWVALLGGRAAGARRRSGPAPPRARQRAPEPRAGRAGSTRPSCRRG